MAERKVSSKSAARSAAPAKSAASEQSAAKSAAPAKSAAKSAAPAGSTATGRSRAKSSTPLAPAVPVYNLRDPWFTLVVSGAKTRHVHWAEPKPAAPGRPDSPGWQDLAKGDIVTFRNPALGFERLCQVQVTVVTHAVTTANVVAKMSEPAMMKASFPTLTGSDQVAAVLGGMAKAPVERPLVVIGFKRVP